ncbi:MAG: hypothetical protein A3E88_05615 [Legionellales bacterium RIFCSPHIGHO2_12_FULL_35_11]|nr:MAG: hypothetical protein A3E88_05615 [Legionellales bacterium RIFCSPHIGHO2_12_FULL_35_11]
MAISIKKSAFARDKTRENEDSSIFNKLYNNFSLFGKVIFAIVVAPTITITSLFSQVVFLIVANCLLALGFLSNFLHRLISRKVSVSEFFLTILVIAALAIAAFYLLPALPGLSIFGAFFFINLIATSINTFFLIRTVVIPPLQSLFNYCMSYFGIESKEKLFYTESLNSNKEEDVTIVRNILGTNTCDPEKKEQAMMIISNQLHLINKYLNKYSEPIFGSINNSDKIDIFLKAKKQILNDRNIDGIKRRIKLKIDWKMTKCDKLSVAKKYLEQSNFNNYANFFNSSDGKFNKEECQKVLNEKITRQNEKLLELKNCVLWPN